MSALFDFSVSKRRLKNFVNTPQVLVDLTVVENNIRLGQKIADNWRIRLRPHIKTHKLPLLARAQIKAGAIGITCQKLSEAEVMCAAGFDDILVSYNIIGAQKLDRLISLSSKCKLTVVADSTLVIDGLAAASKHNNQQIDVLVELDSGMNRCGISAVEQLHTLVDQIRSIPSLNFEGLMSYPAAGGGKNSVEMLTEFAAVSSTRGVVCNTVSSGGTPDMGQLQDLGAVNEYRAGSYIYNDRSLISSGVASEADCALNVLTTVISVSGNRAVVDAGSKALSSDLFGLEGYGCIKGRPDIEILALSEEHGHLLIGNSNSQLSVGDQLKIIPNHACVVSNLYNEITLVRGDNFISTLPIAARGCVT